MLRREFSVNPPDGRNGDHQAEDAGCKAAEESFIQDKPADLPVLPPDGFQKGNLGLPLRHVLPDDLRRRQNGNEKGDTHGDVMHGPDFHGDVFPEPCGKHDPLQPESDEEEEDEETRRKGDGDNGKDAPFPRSDKMVHTHGENG